MNTAHEKPVSLRKFAAMTGTSDGGVRKAVGKKSIDAGFVDGKIVPSVASVEWGKEILTGWLLSDAGEWNLNGVVAVAEVIEAAVAVPVEKPETKPVEIIQPVDPVDEFEETDEDLVYTGAEDVINTESDAAEFLKDIPQGTTKIEAERLYSVFRARKAKRELQKAEGELVDKGMVYSVLFEFAATMRNTFINIPDRVIDNIRASDSRNEAMDILANEINSVLKQLAGIGEIKLTEE